MTDHALTREDELLINYAELLALTVLERANRGIMRLRSRKYRGYKSGLDAIAEWEKHTVVPLDGIDLDRIVTSATEFPEMVQAHGPRVLEVVRAYVRQTLAAAKPYSRAELGQHMRNAGCLPNAA